MRTCGTFGQRGWCRGRSQSRERRGVRVRKIRERGRQGRPLPRGTFEARLTSMPRCSKRDMMADSSSESIGDVRAPNAAGDGTCETGPRLSSQVHGPLLLRPSVLAAFRKSHADSNSLRGSLAALWVRPTSRPIATTKGASCHERQMALEWAVDNIRVNVLSRARLIRPVQKNGSP